ncbi:hypothetical protein VFPFJ_09007 [Purpureocillium lilacinum]|uniref:Uncharacterized protein n=1 Tax=Purpureocillium lilacinum TaxID=33203 RepID=A0A179GZ93_PURLI|nr:hypothetical protein VFPFJ_09007 [Purpureocillium lilacinum]OAQ76054.1 hypothetical protein VFPBJ_08414 [Purpureocillium lilacinum]OAQ83204.1 hypothetical protein VFPFJ_09007 [Purpureocillium lilacinum]
MPLGRLPCPPTRYSHISICFAPRASETMESPLRAQAPPRGTPCAPARGWQTLALGALFVRTMRRYHVSPSEAD